jgi:hypothetical protein
MYNGVYEAMVKAGIVVELEKEVMYYENGEITNDPTLMVGRPSKFRLTSTTHQGRSYIRSR